MPNRLYEQIKALVHIKDNPDFALFDVVEKGLWIGHELTGALLEVYRSLRGTPFQQAELAEALQMFHAEYVIPIDLPINDFLETFVDQQVAALIAPGVKAIDAALDKKLPHGPDAA